MTLNTQSIAKGHIRLNKQTNKGQLYCMQSELRSCVNVEEAVLGSPSLIVLMVSVDVKQHCAIVGYCCSQLDSIHTEPGRIRLKE